MGIPKTFSKNYIFDHARFMAGKHSNIYLYWHSIIQLFLLSWKRLKKVVCTACGFRHSARVENRARIGHIEKMDSTTPPPHLPTLDLGVIGNCTISALVDQQGCIVWGCFPRFDSDPVFCSLLRGSENADFGFFSIELVDQARASQRYARNSAVLETILYDTKGGSVQIIDFAPRYHHYGRMFHPTMIVRRIKCLSGLPRLIVRLRPADNQGTSAAEKVLGSNHIRFTTRDQNLRLTTDGPAALIYRETPFVLHKEMTLILGPDEPLQDSPAHVGRIFQENTFLYWKDWVRHLSLPLEWQDVVIRAAITLALCSYDETGGIVAALTTSIPEYEGTGRTWDYRYCWLRDAFFVVQALNRLGAARTMENYIGYVKNIVVASTDQFLQPLYGLSYEKDIPETIASNLRGYRNNGPVRFGNAAFHQIQNDSYGSVILALMQNFFDERLDHDGDPQLFALLEGLGEQALRSWNAPDAGLWEYRTRTAVHTYSAAMCWAACDRLAKIATQLKQEERARKWRDAADPMRQQILENAWNTDIESLTSSFGGKDLDASLLLLPEIGLIAVDDPRFVKTLQRIEENLKCENGMYRYRHADDFGLPETTFTVCSLWYAQTLHRLGRSDEAREVFLKVLEQRNSLGLLSEGFHPESREMWGNYPQTYSMVGLIQVARLLSKPWDQEV